MDENPKDKKEKELQGSQGGKTQNRGYLSKREFTGKGRGEEKLSVPRGQIERKVAIPR